MPTSCYKWMVDSLVAGSALCRTKFSRGSDSFGFGASTLRPCNSDPQLHNMQSLITINLVSDKSAACFQATWTPKFMLSEAKSRQAKGNAVLGLRNHC